MTTVSLRCAFNCTLRTRVPYRSRPRTCETLKALRRDPCRGRAVVLEIQKQPSGYALLIAFWSNELGGNICEVDELFVLPEYRSQGFGKSLFEAIAQGDLWPTPIVGIALGV